MTISFFFTLSLMTSTYPSLKTPKNDGGLVYRPDIDGLRAIAILAVLIYHAFPTLLPAGFIGVDIFFVISGFLISEITLKELERETFSFRYFYTRRIQRIFPSLIVVLMACLILGWTYSLADTFKELGKHVAGASIFLTNILLWNESDYFDMSSADKPLLHLWSLGIEAQFYLLWPAILWATWKYRLPILQVMIFLTIISFVLSFLSLPSHRIMSFYALQNRFWELSIGSILAYATLHDGKNCAPHFLYAKIISNARFTTWFSRHKKLFCNLRGWTGLAFIIIGFFSIHARQFPGIPVLLPTMGAALIISGGAKAWLNHFILSNKILVGLGLISFPLYLWHWPLLSFGPLPSDMPHSFIVRSSLILLSLLLAWLTYHFVEKPLRSRSHSLIKTKLLIFGLLGTGSLGLLTYEQDGFGLRFHDPVQAINELAQISDVYKYFNFKSLLRTGICDSVTTQDANKNHCIDRREKNIFIWGDSYAASLYSGLDTVRREEGQNYGISQMTDGNGPPFYDDKIRTASNQTLTEANEGRLDAVKHLQPDVVVIAWMMNGVNGLAPKEKALDALGFTILQIKLVDPNTKIVVFGPFPYWNGTLIGELVGFYKRNHFTPPAYMQEGLAGTPKLWDDFFKEAVPKLGVTYLSVYDALCNEYGCLTRTGDRPSDLVAIDYGHLTQNGSSILIEKFKDAIFF